MPRADVVCGNSIFSAKKCSSDGARAEQREQTFFFTMTPWKGSVWMGLKGRPNFSPDSNDCDCTNMNINSIFQHEICSTRNIVGLFHQYVPNEINLKNNSFDIIKK